MSNDADRIGRFFASRFKGKWRRDERALEQYSTDMSMYRILPRVVAFPRDEEDLQAVIDFAQEERIPLTPRCGGSSTSGSAIGSGILLVLTVSQRFGAMSDVEAPLAGGGAAVTAGVGVRHTRMQETLAVHGCFLPSDPTSGPLSYIGGNVAAKASGPHALRHGSIDRYLQSVRFLTADGRLVDTSRPETIPAELARGVVQLGGRILADRPSADRLTSRLGMKTASGYNLFTFVRREAAEAPEPRGTAASGMRSAAGMLAAGHITQLMAGSVGTLGVLLDATLVGIPRPEGRAVLLAAYRSTEAACASIAPARELGAAAVELMSSECIEILRERFPDIQLPEPGTLLIMTEFIGPDRMDCIRRLQDELNGLGGADLAELRVADGEEEQERLWTARKRLMMIVRNFSDHHKALSVVNDVGVPEERLAELIGSAESIFRGMGLVAPIFGHAGSGNLHLRPLFDIRSPDIKETVVRVADAVYDAVLRLGGTITAEHGMGRLRTAYLEREWGPDIYGFMKEVKRLFDPEDILNPDCMFSGRSLADDMFVG